MVNGERYIDGVFILGACYLKSVEEGLFARERNKLMRCTKLYFISHKTQKYQPNIFQYFTSFFNSIKSILHIRSILLFYGPLKYPY